MNKISGIKLVFSLLNYRELLDFNLHPSRRKGAEQNRETPCQDGWRPSGMQTDHLPHTAAGQRLKPVLIHTKLGVDAQMFREAVR